MRRLGLLLVFVFVFVVAGAAACGLEPEKAEAAEQALGEAVHRAHVGVKKGAVKAKRSWRNVERDYGPTARRDWKRLQDAASRAWQDVESQTAPGGPSADESALPDRWWDKAGDAVDCPKPPAGTCRVERWFIEAAQRHPHRIKGGLRLTPVYDPKRPEQGNVGIEVRSISSGSILDELGFEDGDEVRTVNGLAVARPLSQMSLYSQLRERQRFEVVFARHTVQHRQIIQVVDAL